MEANHSCRSARVWPCIMRLCSTCEQCPFCASADATEVTDSQKRKAPADGGPPRRTKKGKKGRRGGNSSASGSVAAEAAPQDLVAVSPLPPNSEILQVTEFRKTSVSVNRNPIISL